MKNLFWIGFSILIYANGSRSDLPMITDGNFTTPLETSATEWLGLYVFAYFLSDYVSSLVL